MGVNALTFLWGFAEATLFFIVPDVLLSLVALKSRRRAWVASAFAVAGAVLGGGFMYLWAVRNAAAVNAVLVSIPAITPELVSTVDAELENTGLFSLFIGSVTGVPYKIYAAAAGTAALPLTVFLLASIPARGLRFLLVTALVNAVARRWLTGMARRRQAGIVLGCWLVFYGWYFSVMG